MQHDGIIVSTALQQLGHAGQIDAQGQATITAVVRETICAEQQRWQRTMRIIHSLQWNTRDGAVKIRFSDQLIERFHQLLQERTNFQFCFKPMGRICFYKCFYLQSAGSIRDNTDPNRRTMRRTWLLEFSRHFQVGDNPSQFPIKTPHIQCLGSLTRKLTFLVPN